jgi:hypothetical protein
MQPNDYYADVTGPVLERWFIGRDTFSTLYLFFDEPCKVMPGAVYTLYIGGANVGYTLNIVRYSYSSFNKEIRAEFSNSCLPSNSSCLSYISTILAASSDSLYLSISSNSVNDYALIPNPNAAYNSILQGQPICSPCEQGLYMASNCTSSSDRVCSKCGSWYALYCSL